MQQLQSGGKKGFPPETSKINLILEQHSLFPNLNSTAAKEKQSTYPEQICNNITSTLQYTQGGLTENRTNMLFHAAESPPIYWHTKGFPVMLFKWLAWIFGRERYEEWPWIGSCGKRWMNKVNVTKFYTRLWVIADNLRWISTDNSKRCYSLNEVCLQQNSSFGSTVCYYEYI